MMGCAGRTGARTRIGLVSLGAELPMWSFGPDMLAAFRDRELRLGVAFSRSGHVGFRREIDGGFRATRMAALGRALPNGYAPDVLQPVPYAPACKRSTIR
jgi:hypothetical protein